MLLYKRMYTQRADSGVSMNLNALSGQTLGQYELGDLLGVGGMGAVYKGYQPSLEREVAIKIIFSRWADSAADEYQARFVREARMAASLEHAHIVPVYDFGTENGVSYVVMRLLSGGSLADRILHSRHQNLPLSLAEVARITTHLASALLYAHKRGVIHRDIKASNVMFDDEDNVFLVDFGIAKLANSTSQRLTDTGVKIGTPEFMAPEQWLNEPLTPAVDQYSLAILVYLMLTGQMPFKGEMPYQFMHSHLYEPPTPLIHWRNDLPQSLMPVLDRAMNKDPKERYADVVAFAQAFTDAVQTSLGPTTLQLSLGKPIVETIILPDAAANQAITPVKPRTRRIGLAAAAAVITAVVLGGLAILSGGTPNDLALAAGDSNEAILTTATSTPAATNTAADLPAATHTPTHTPTNLPTATDTATATETQAPSPTAQVIAFAGEPATITLPLLSLETGTSAVVEAEIDCTTQDCETLDITIEFDPDVLQVQAVETGPYLGETVITRSNLVDNAAGMIRLVAATPDETTVMDEPIILRMNIQARNPGVSQLRIVDLDMTTAEGDAQYVVGVDGGVIVSGMEATRQPTCQYRVQTGDTLSGIALANGVTVDQINELNEIPNRSIIRVGQVLTIPASDCRAPFASSQVQSSANSEIIEVHDCRHLGGNVFEWYSVRRDFDSDGSPVSETRVGGPYSGAWQPGCPGSSPSSTGGGSSNGGSSSSGGSSSGSGGTSGGGGETSGGGGSSSEDDDDDDGLLCLLLC